MPQVMVRREVGRFQVSQRQNLHLCSGTMLTKPMTGQFRDPKCYVHFICTDWGPEGGGRTED